MLAFIYFIIDGENKYYYFNIQNIKWLSRRLCQGIFAAIGQISQVNGFPDDYASEFLLR